ncbi:MAG: hypothetical protein HQL22_12515, partial [Candidatus Omnitrophica bacterium]|nr:hypothetical protein [Candidatus Omnitrophota bacterium]
CASIALSNGETLSGVPSISNAETTVAAMLGRDKYGIIDGHPDKKDPERGPLFRFLNYFKAAADTGNQQVYGNERKSLEYFYVSSASTPGCPVAADLTAGADTNRWRAGNDLFCARNWDDKKGYILPHSSNCPFHPKSCDGIKRDADGKVVLDPLTGKEEVDSSSCSCDMSPDKASWTDDKFDEMVTDLREFKTVMDIVASSSLRAEALFKNAPEVANDAFVGAFGDGSATKGTIEKIRDGLLKAKEVLADDSHVDTDYVISGAGSLDLKRASKNALIITAHLDDAIDNAFSCKNVNPDNVADCQTVFQKSGLLDPNEARLAYLRELLARARKSANKEAISTFLIYGWQSEASGGLRGYRHVIKVQAATPRRCDWWTAERGSLAKSCGTETFPWIKTAKKGAFKRCYFLADGTGCVKVRISRWDEDRLSRAMSFFGGAPLWTVLSGHAANFKGSAPKGLEACFGTDRVEVNGTKYYIPESFMINREEDYATKYGLECAAAVNDALARSFVTEVCAKYIADGDRGLYRMKFIPCDQSCGKLFNIENSL